MPIDRSAPVALFLFAHQDDEFGVFQALLACREAGLAIACAYLTRSPDPALAQRRNAESLRVLATFGIEAENVAFAGDTLAIDDATLPEHIHAAAAWIEGWFAAFDNVASIYVTAWEGGHHDHDCLHAISADLAGRMGLLGRLRQYALYNRLGCPGPLFKVLSPLAANGAIESTRIPFLQRLRYLRLCLSYPSQRVTWIGLFPFVLLHYLLRQVQTLQSVVVERTLERPHAGLLYYEYRQFYRWEKLQERLAAWRSKDVI
jgi:LmbE family N-acetylglucosaminyl deacetylase